ncbi:MAG: 4'-phosphopantetheinyl transferase family protein [Gemmatimonadaceae bacterium]
MRPLRRMLSAREMESFGQLQLQRRRDDWLAGRLAAKAVARDAMRLHFRIRPAHSAISILNASDGAPYIEFEDHPELNGEFNISIAHDGGFAIVALAHTARCGVVGVDLERDRPLADRLIHRVLTRDELQRVQADASCRVPLLALWCLKEAVLKASRKASRISMRNVDLTWNRRGQVTARIQNDDREVGRISALWCRRGRHVLAYAINRFASAC